jgi:hypothetical protein
MVGGSSAQGLVGASSVQIVSFHSDNGGGEGGVAGIYIGEDYCPTNTLLMIFWQN